MPISDFKAIAMFAKAVELGSIRQAALAQGVSPQAASQTIAQLEQHLGVRLLHRTTRSLALTEEGQRFLENTQPALAALDRALALAQESKEEVTGPLRIVGPKSSFAAILMPLLDEFCREHPGIQRWPHAFGQFSEIFKWNVRGNHAADLIAGSVAKYASSGV